MHTCPRGSHSGVRPFATCDYAQILYLLVTVVNPGGPNQSHLEPTVHTVPDARLERQGSLYGAHAPQCATPVQLSGLTLHRARSRVTKFAQRERSSGACVLCWMDSARSDGHTSSVWVDAVSTELTGQITA